MSLWKGSFPSALWKNSPAAVASIANATTPSSSYQVRKAAVARLAPAMAAALKQNQWNGILVIAFVSAPNASIPCENVSSLRWSAGTKKQSEVQRPDATE